jgi:cytochrome c peroxidase
MQGDITALNTSQKRGFNLFMGKAACGTCHFAPVLMGWFRQIILLLSLKS